jgi:hypothetical protein
VAMHKAEVLGWLLTLPDDAQVGIDAGGLSLVGFEAHDTPAMLSDLPYLEVGGLPAELEP